MINIEILKVKIKENNKNRNTKQKQYDTFKKKHFKTITKMALWTPSPALSQNIKQNFTITLHPGLLIRRVLRASRVHTGGSAQRLCDRLREQFASAALTICIVIK